MNCVDKIARCFLGVVVAGMMAAGAVAAATEGSYKYEDFKSPKSCKGCHKEIYQQWKKSLMSQSFTHEWDQVEYFKLALPHAEKLEKVSGVKAGCIACHAPLAFLAGDIPPKPAEAGTRANEGVSCDLCHVITGSSQEEPFNFSFEVEPGNEKKGPRADAKAPHKTAFSKFHNDPKFCATCHDEQSPYGAWVKATYREWAAGPYAKEGATCQTCHMPKAPGKSASMGKQREDIHQHQFQGSHSEEKLKGAVDLALYTSKTKIAPGATLKIRAELFNGKVGHYIPSGSTEERMLWLEVWAIDSNGKRYAIPVTAKGFPGEEFTIADSSAMTYQAIGEIMEIKDFKGLKRDGNLPDGARIFRKPFFDPKGRMTVCQWYTKDNEKVDYRIGPRETKIERYKWAVPADLPKGKVKIVANLFYSQIPSSIGEFFKLPKDEYRPILVNSSTLELEVK